jgi:hypothetical protein
MSLNIGRNRQIHRVFLEQPFRRGKGGEIKNLERYKWDEKIKDNVKI